MVLTTRNKLLRLLLVGRREITSIRQQQWSVLLGIRKNLFGLLKL